MIHQIEHFSPHKNAKVFAVLMAVSSFVFFIPFFFLIYFAAPTQNQPSLWVFALMPVFYLILGYAMVAFGCWLYNTLFRYIGGIEFTSQSDRA